MSGIGGDRGRGSGPPKTQDHKRVVEPKGAPNLGSVEQQRQQAAAEIDHKLRVWRKRGEAAAADSAANAVPTAASSGEPLGADVRRKMEPRLGADLSSAKLHTGGESATAAASMNARAFTVGNDVHFGAGQFAPGTKEGDKLLAHELTHVVQGQRSGIQRKADGDGDGAAGGAEVSQPHEPAEQEADAVADHVAGQLHDGEKGAAGGHEAGAPAAAGGKGATAAAPQSPGATAKPATISAKLSSVALKVYRAGGATAPAPGGAPPGASGGAAGGKGGAGPAAAPADPLKAFHDALAATDGHRVTNEWQKLAPADQKKVTQADVLSTFDVAPPIAFKMMQTLGADFSAVAYTNKFLSISMPSQYQTQLSAAGLWDSFVKAPPQRAAVSQDQANVLSGFVRGTKARDIFEKVYPKLQDATYNAAWLKTTPWQPDDISRLYRAFAGLPVGHVQASSGGFFLGTDENLSGKGFQPLGFAWQDGDRMVMPKNSSNATGGGTGHDMTGGTNSGAAKVAGTAGGGATQSHFVGSATHEVGHAVANKVGGDAWSTTRNAFAPLAHDAWSQALFNDAAVDKELAAKKASKAVANVMSAADARNYLVGKITGNAAPPAKWSEPDADAFLTAHLSAQPLYQYWAAKKSWGDTYQLPATNIVGGKAYAYLTRFNNQTCTYNAATYQNKVSWYSVSSPAEWFAENYSHYYRMQKNHPEADAKKYFDDLDTKFSATSPNGGMPAPGAATVGAAPAGAGAGQGQPGAQAKGDGQGEGGGIPPSIHRMPFAW